MESRRMAVFRDIIKALAKEDWEKNIDRIPDMLIEEGIFRPEERTIVEKYMRLCSGLGSESHGNEPISHEIKNAMLLDKIEEPLVTILEEICKNCRSSNNEKCRVKCDHEAIEDEEGKNILIKNGKCINCGKCIPDCPFEAIADKIEYVPLVNILKEKKKAVYAAVAPAYIAQFGDNLKMGQIRNAFRAIGFTDMVEVALFADVLTLREAHEFEEHVKKKGDYMITSCCCPVWMNMIKNGYPELLEHFTPMVSPMIASGRVLKLLYPDCVVVFVGPCIAKKSEAKSKELAGAVDFVLTFEEVDQIFKALDINIADMPDDPKHQSSYGGRIYARTGGVSKAVEMTVKRVGQPGIKLKAIQGNGVKECKAILDDLKNGVVKANFIEGMGCIGGCVGGPRALRKVDEATEIVDKYAKKSKFETPAENIRIPIVLSKIGIPESLGIENMEIVELLNRDMI